MRKIAILLAVLLVAGCGEEESTVEAKPRAEVETTVHAQADAVATAAGAKLEGYQANSAPCDTPDGNIADDGRWNLTGFAAIPLAADRHVATLKAIKERWQADGWQISDDRTLPDGVRGSLSGVAPGSGLSVSVTSSDPPKQLALIVASPCYRPVDGEDPANQ